MRFPKPTSRSLRNIIVPENTGHIAPLPRDVPVYIGRQAFVIEHSRGKNVLHLGCVDAGLMEDRQQRGLWLHDRVCKVAKSVWGVDVDEEGLQLMRSQGYPNLYNADIEHLDRIPDLLYQDFDLILLTEVMEHLNNPGRFLVNLKPLFKSTTEMLVTVPNATSLLNLIENLNARELVHPDHNYWYSLHTIRSLFEKHGYEAHCVGVYSQHNFHRSISGHLWNKITGKAAGSTSEPVTAIGNLAPQGRKSSITPDVRGWIKATAITIIFRVLISRNPFFADGLILLVKTV